MLVKACKRTIEYLLSHPATISYIGFIVILNTIFSYVPDLHIGRFDISAADFLVGLIYVVRDLAQRESGHKVIIAMLVACLISYLLSEPQAAFASVAAFVVGESLDWSIFTFTGKPLSQRILLSALISSPADSIVNLYFLNQLNTLGLAVMIVMKGLGVFCLWLMWRQRQRHYYTVAAS